MGKKRPHVNALILMQAWLVQTFGVRFVHPGAPIDVAPEDMPTSEPEPDLIVTREDLAHFHANPRPSDLLLVVEIADTTLSFDLTSKARLYARAGIAEYWVLDIQGDIQGRRLIAHRQPSGNSYGEVSAYQEDEFVKPLSAPAAAIRARDLFV